MKALVLKHREWDRIFAQVRQDYAHSPATYLIRTRMVEDLGWTWRDHVNWREYSSHNDDSGTDYRDHGSRIHIDFYSEEARTYFLLKYMNRD